MTYFSISTNIYRTHGPIINKIESVVVSCASEIYEYNHKKIYMHEMFDVSVVRI